MAADPLPRCPHGNEAQDCGPYSHRGEIGNYHIIRALAEKPNRRCECAVFAHGKDRARRAWVALCGEDGK